MHLQTRLGWLGIQPALCKQMWSFSFPEFLKSHRGVYLSVRPPIASMQTAERVRTKIPWGPASPGASQEKNTGSVTEFRQQKGAVVIYVWSHEGGRRERPALTDSWPVPGTCQSLCSHWKPGEQLQGLATQGSNHCIEVTLEIWTTFRLPATHTYGEEWLFTSPETMTASRVPVFHISFSLAAPSPIHKNLLCFIKILNLHSPTQWL